MPVGDDDRIPCATYTHARRHPMVLGHIGGWKPPFQLSVTQLAVLVVTFWLEVQTWHLWGARLPRLVGLVVGVAIPCALAWATRHTRIEGRSLPRAALGWLTLLGTPRRGHVSGRPCHEARAARPGLAPVYVAPGDDEGSWR
jgi:hypothetical protein